MTTSKAFPWSDHVLVLTFYVNGKYLTVYSSELPMDITGTLVSVDKITREQYEQEAENGARREIRQPGEGISRAIPG